MSSYYDRRAQAKYVGKNLDALLANQTETEILVPLRGP